MEKRLLQQLRLPLDPQLQIWEQLPTAAQEELREMCVRLILEHLEEARMQDDNQDPT